MDMTGSWLVSEGGGTSHCAVASPEKVSKRFNVW